MFFGWAKSEDLSPTAAMVRHSDRRVRLPADPQLDPGSSSTAIIFYKDRYDYRRTLIEFARELGSQTDLTKMLETVADRLIRTLRSGTWASSWPMRTGRFHLQMTHGAHDRDIYPNALDLSFLSAQPDKSYLFFERTRHALDVVSREMPPASGTPSRTST